MRRLFLGLLTIGVQLLLHALIASVPKTLGLVSEMGSTALEEFEIVLSTTRRANDLFAFSTDYKLRL